MAQAGTITGLVRNESNRLLDGFAVVDIINNLVDGTGDTDQARLAFFEAFFNSQQDYDLTIAEFTAAVLALRDLATWRDDNLVVLSKLRI